MRGTRSSGSAEGVMGNCDPYSDPSEPVVVMQPKCTVEGADIVMQSVARAKTNSAISALIEHIEVHYALCGFKCLFPLATLRFRIFAPLAVTELRRMTVKIMQRLVFVLLFGSGAVEAQTEPP